MITPDMLARYLQRVLNQPMRLKLFTDLNGLTPIEPVGGGYEDRPIGIGDWSIDGQVAIVTTPIEFRFNGTARFTMRGAYLVDASGQPYWVEPFDRELPVGRAGDVIPVQPIIRLQAGLNPGDILRA